MKKIKNIVLSILFIIILLYFIKYILKTNIKYEQALNNPVKNGQQIITSMFTKAYISKIIDGDTVEAVINSKKYKVRFIGIDCPEYTSKIEYYGKESTAYTEYMLINKYVFLEKDINETDKYGRLLRYVWLEIPNSTTISEIKSKMFNCLLIAKGYANVVTYPPDIKYSRQFKEILTEAKTNNIGLWNQ